jgi:hypothetical protein
MENWIKVFEDVSPVRAEIVKGVLASQGIGAVILDRKESAYKIHGYCEVMVQKENASIATKIIEDEVTF